jgi:DnaK suppressor protein
MVTAATPSPYIITIIWWLCYGPPRATEGTTMTEQSEMSGFHEILARKEAELAHVLRKRDGITIEKSADQMDEIQYATERDMAIRNVDRESSLLRDVRDALRRVEEGSFGTCVDCESAISPKRLVAVPWAARCIHCQEAADRARLEGTETPDTLLNAA